MFVHNVLLMSFAFGGFALFHSLMAGAQLKTRLKRVLDARIVEGWYRLVYNLLAIVSIVPVLALLATLPDLVLYSIPFPYAIGPVGVQGVGLLGLLWSLFSFDLWRFVGISQALAYLSGEALPLADEPLQEKGAFSLVRHPVYFFSLLLIWATSIMTLNLLLFNMWATIYVVIGSLIEEHRLEGLYGDTYRSYRRRVSWLIPCPPSHWWRKHLEKLEEDVVN